MTDGLSIKNLAGAVKAFADAADQNNDGVIDKTEMKLFNQFINGAQLTQDKGLKVERERVGDVVGQDDPKKARKAENKTYKDLFGKAEIADVKLSENEANRRVIREFNKLKGAVSPEELNNAIAARPDMADYNGDAEGYKKALEAWANNVEHALEKSIMQHTTDVGSVIMDQNDVNTATIIAGELALAEQAGQNAQKLENTIKQEGADTRDEVVEQGAKTRSAVHAEGAATRATVHQEASETRRTVHEEGARTRNTVRDEGAKTRNVVREEEAETRNTVRDNGAKTRNIVRQTAQETQEIEAAADNVIARLDKDGAVHKEETRTTVLNLKNEIVRSNLFHDKKLDFLDRLAELSAHDIIDSEALENLQNEFDFATSYALRSYEFASKEENPVPEEPYHENVGEAEPAKGSSTPKSKNSDEENNQKDKPSIPFSTPELNKNPFEKYLQK